MENESAADYTYNGDLLAETFGAPRADPAAPSSILEQQDVIPHGAVQSTEGLWPFSDQADLFLPSDDGGVVYNPGQISTVDSITKYIGNILETGANLAASAIRAVRTVRGTPDSPAPTQPVARQTFAKTILGTGGFPWMLVVGVVVLFFGVRFLRRA